MRITTERALHRALAMMREKVGDELTIDDLARAAMFSKFHFTRVFQKATGLSPGRFLSAIRIQEAKRLLTTTHLTVAAISSRVGYTSVGTFTSRFNRSVGLSPATYRRRAGCPPLIGPDRPAAGEAATIHGQLYRVDQRADGPVFVGLFPEPIADGWPVSWTVVDGARPYRLDRVAPGSWHILARMLGTGPATGDRYLDDSGVALTHHGPVTIRRGSAVRQIDLALRPAQPFDPPALLAVMDLTPAQLATMLGTAGPPPTPWAA